jgi:hypothetical protein
VSTDGLVSIFGKVYSGKISVEKKLILNLAPERILFPLHHSFSWLKKAHVLENMTGSSEQSQQYPRSQNIKYKHYT